MEPQFEKFIQWGFFGLTSGLMGFAVTFLSRISKSIVTLNSQVSVLLERSQNLDHRVTKLENHLIGRGR